MIPDLTRRLALTIVATLMTTAAYAQSSPNLYDGFVPSSTDWNSYFANKLDAFDGVGVSPTFDNATISGTLTVTGQLVAEQGFGGIAALNGATPGVFTNTQMNDPFTMLLNGTSVTTEFQTSHPGNFSTQAFASGVTVPSSSTVYDSAAVAGYVNNLSTTTSGTAAEFYARNSVAGGHVYGINPLVVDGNGAANFASTMVGAEFDNGAYNLGSTVYGINNIGVFPNGTPLTAVAYQVAALNAPWQYAFLTGDGSSENGILLGSATTSAGSNSQQILLNTRDNTNTARECSVTGQSATGTANIALVCPNGGGVIDSGGLLVGGAATFNAGAEFVGAGIGIAVTNGVSVGGNLNLTGNLLMSGTFTISGTLPGGTPATYACFTSAGQLISSASPC